MDNDRAAVWSFFVNILCMTRLCTYVSIERTRFTNCRTSADFSLRLLLPTAARLIFALLILFIFGFIFGSFHTLSAFYRFSIGFVSAFYRLCIGFLSALYRLCIGFLSFIYRLSIVYLSAFYRLSFSLLLGVSASSVRSTLGYLRAC